MKKAIAVLLVLLGVLCFYAAGAEPVTENEAEHTLTMRAEGQDENGIHAEGQPV